MDQRAECTDAHTDPPDQRVVAECVVEGATQHDPEKAAELMAEEYDAIQCSQVAQAIDLCDEARRQRHGRQPERTHECGEDENAARCDGGKNEPAGHHRAGRVDRGRFFFQAEDGIRDFHVTGVQTCALPISELLDPRFEVVETGRGGRYTYHGPGQRVGYVLLDLSKRGRDVRRFVHALEDWVIATLGDLGVEAWSAPERIGIWTRDVDGSEAKIGAIGVRVRRWVTMHGFSVNLDPDLGHFAGIVPCGIADYGVTSLARLGLAVAPEEWDGALRARFDGFLRALEAELR